jgi:hypothetical protein
LKNNEEGGSGGGGQQGPAAAVCESPCDSVTHLCAVCMCVCRCCRQRVYGASTACSLPCTPPPAAPCYCSNTASAPVGILEAQPRCNNMKVKLEFV